MDKELNINDRHDTESDEIIYARYLKTSDNNDLKELLVRHRSDLTFFIYGIVKNSEDAEEIMLDAFAEAASGTARFSGKSSFKTWLFGIGRNLAMKHLRKKRFLFFSLNEEIADGDEITAQKGVPDTEFIKNERDRMLYQALNSINPEYRQALHLIYFENMTSDETAVIMKKSKKQIYNLISRGKQAMKEALEKLGYEFEE
ncbi:MAG: sigma-70 family RNA polymerase sigma factor [Lachnospiraceae bacterium]|nr:sigma-70 family RNA polymerase sigma factor [Lachnospiraceae bacterium]